MSAQGVGNTLCGALGVLPMTGVIVRSGANVEAGAKTRLSAILHGSWLLMFASLLPWTLTYVPLSALAAVLVYTGYKLAYPKIVPTLIKYGNAKVLIYAVTIDHDRVDRSVEGRARRAWRCLWPACSMRCRGSTSARISSRGSNRVDLYMDGTATLIGLPKLAQALEALPAGSQVFVHIKDLDYIDHACLDLHDQLGKAAQDDGRNAHHRMASAGAEVSRAAWHRRAGRAQSRLSVHI